MQFVVTPNLVGSGSSLQPGAQKNWQQLAKDGWAIDRLENMTPAEWQQVREKAPLFDVKRFGEEDLARVEAQCKSVAAQLRKPAPARTR